ncbi:MAG TPA: transcription-repair coupling factor [Candidatus Margulisbacteria bacterium]|nr:MAG: transcription-repair coupling factor [Candidatus Margulisbacteria bacterium GWD2_39_127]OGI02133.1 MAG: transcription-repair coupling factor [Candidatus Margulisbacteria bacterium GWF2_38_17]OGI10509.1 MAG: transcription-repair coupling factor [Candidatus Margulisbacteria bacterium GWE2_39_32]HAR62407.1 transcription-repair coupling factor [Candidatus Margulisiibacteriota bacterium]HCT86029.1 transcription-repair coupling factor [Candidatus Margulisiibacteriota bacterium]
MYCKKIMVRDLLIPMIKMNRIVIELKSPEKIPHSNLVFQLVNQNYRRVPLVLNRGEFAVRGDIIDVFAQNHSHPVRVEYFGDKVEDVRTFDINTQCSINKLDKVMFSENERESLVFSRLPNSGGASLAIVAQYNDGDHVVHENHGVAVYRGLKHLATNSIEGEYLLLEYKGNDKLYVPLEQINLIHKFDDSGVVAQIHSLSDSQWRAIKRKAQKATQNIARELLQLYKVRYNQPGYAFSADSVWQIDLEETFPYEETKDQEKAILEVKKDMETPRPMDRLICGDVGFGKTEIAIRAAFKASLDSKQVAILVPTTVLAQQHYLNCISRFQEFGLIVEVLTRFRSKKEQIAVIQKLKEGKVDVIIGTHRLLQGDIQFKDIGLLIIDEEQRFGVVHKEKLKQFRKTVDVLTMTATPIPRTLYMSLSGVRDISVISTPPQGREPVRTIVEPYNEDIIKQAVEKEIARGGQVFYLHNDVRSLEKTAKKISSLVPEAKVGVAHGQMKGHSLEKIMLDFLDKHYDILACSTIIESGLDIANVNTIIIIDADKFGLSQLHQLRGRVGRTSKNAFAYLLYQPGKVLSKDARERLEAIAEYTALGSGFNIAMKDLQIRGAGNVLGAEQHGNMVAIGFELYCKLLQDSISRARGESVPQAKEFITGLLHIPDYYIEDHKQKIAIYQRLFSSKKTQDIEEVAREMEDRFGKPPEEVVKLVKSLKDQLT